MARAAIGALFPRAKATETVTVIGPTGWGTTLAVLLARNGHTVSLLARSADEAGLLDTARENRRHRPGLAFPPSLAVTADSSVLTSATLVVLAVPSPSLKANLARYAGSIAPAATVVSAIKGIDPLTGERMSEVVAGAGIAPSRLVVLSGPNFAREIALGLPAASVVAGSDPERTAAVQAALMSAALRIYTSSDTIGVEIGGALKNVIAIACGIAHGLGLGDNAQAALITRGLAEITRLGVALGAQPLTFLGLSGLGDLVATSSSDLSRNRRFGEALATGKTVAEASAAVDGVIEGIVTARSVSVLQDRAGVEMPICAQLRAVLFEGKDLASSMTQLMLRAPRSESETV